MKKTAVNFLLLLFAALVMALAIWGPEAISGYRDKSVLNIRIVPESREEGCPVSWNEAAYEVFCYME